MRTLAAKLEAFDAFSREGYRVLLDFIASHEGEIIAVARARLIEGHYRYGDRLMYEYDQGALLAEILQEAADAVNYMTLAVEREEKS